VSPTQRIDKEAVLAAALALINEEGAGRLTMRALANRLGVQAASLYHHVTGRDELLRMVADKVAQAAIEQIPPTTDWRAYARGLANGLRSVLQEHPGAAQVVAVQEVSPTVFAPVAPVVDDLFLPALDVDREAVLHLLQGLYVLVVGLVAAESGSVPQPPVAPTSYYEAWYEVTVETFLDGIACRVQR